MKSTTAKVLATSVGHAVEHWHFSALPLLIPFVAAEYGLSYFQSGLMITFSSIAAFILSVPGSLSVDVLGKRRICMMGALCFPAAGLFFLGLTPSYGWVFPCIILLGFGASFWHAPAMSLLTSMFPKRKGFALSAHELGANTGDFLTPLILGAMIAALGWRMTTHFLIIPAGIMALLIFFIIRDYDAGHGSGLTLRVYSQGIKQMLQNRIVLAMAGVSALRTMGQVVMVAFLPLYLTRVMNFSSTQLGIYISSLTVASFFSAPLTGWLSDRIGRGPILIAGMFAGAGCIIMLGLAPAGLGFQILLFAIGIFLYSIRPVIFAAAFDVTPTEIGGSMVGLLFMTNLAFSAIAATAAGFLADTFSINIIFYFAAIALVAGAILAVIANPAMRRVDEATLATASPSEA